MRRDLLDELFRQVEPRVLALAAGAVLGIGLLASVLYVLAPAWRDYRSLEARHTQALESFEFAASDPAESIALLEQEVGDLRDALYGGSGDVPRSEIESFVVNALDRISSRHGVVLLGITPDEPTSVWMFEELPYAVRVAGPFFAVHRWLYDVEEELRPMVVKQFDLSPNRADEGVVLELRVVAYRAPEEQGA